MLEDALGRLIGGAVWGLGAGLALTLARNGAPGLRAVAKGVVKASVGTADRVREMAAEARENTSDLVAEVRAESPGEPPSPGRTTRRSALSAEEAHG